MATTIVHNGIEFTVGDVVHDLYGSILVLKVFVTYPGRAWEVPNGEGYPTKQIDDLVNSSVGSEDCWYFDCLEVTEDSGRTTETWLYNHR